jgi:hypothetical protein
VSRGINLGTPRQVHNAVLIDDEIHIFDGIHDAEAEAPDFTSSGSGQWADAPAAVTQKQIGEG